MTGGKGQAPVASLRSMGRQPTILWMECGACSGESMAILDAEGRGKPGHTLPAFLEDHGAHLLWHPSLSLESPREAAAIIDRVIAGEQPLTLLCVEGSIIHGPNGTGRFDVFEGRPKRDIVAALCGRAQYVLAMGSCASFGGIPAAPPTRPSRPACSTRTASRAAYSTRGGGPPGACRSSTSAPARSTRRR